MDEAISGVIGRFVAQYGTWSGDVESPNGEYTSLNVAASDVPWLLHEFGQGVQVTESDLTGHYVVIKKDGTIRAQKYTGPADLAAAQEHLRAEHLAWVARQQGD